MTLNLNDLAIFVEVAEKGSFVQAAQSLGLPKTTVSRRIAALEGALGRTLFYRTTRQVRLSDDGAQYLQHCAPALRRLTEAHHQFQHLDETPRGRLRLVSSFVIGNDLLRPLLSAFHQRYPDIEMEILLENRYLDLIEHEVDLALRVGPSPDSSFLARKVAVFRYVLCASPAYLTRAGAPIVPEDLQHHRCLLTSSSRQAVNWAFENLQGEQKNMALRSHFRCNHLALCQALACDGLGITLLPDFMVSADLAQGRLHSVMQDWTCQPRTLYAVYPPQRYTPLPVRLFLDHLSAQLPRS
ncbi:MAG: LysR family transcriptional regulator [Candidatus Sericytochromatia bacterium]|nr:LysR family transcriptional regulator [Candidatus Sericytochromatia bacterium]